MMIDTNSLTAFTTQIVAAHVGRNPTASAELPALIHSVHQALSDIETSAPDRQQAINAADIVPPVPIDQSIMPSYIVCLEDGKRLRMLKRYLMSRYGMTADQYRKKWGLPDNYPMVAPEVSERRREIAKGTGLGGGAVAGRKPAAVKAAPKKRTRSSN